MEEILRYYQELHDSLGKENLCQELEQKIIQIMRDVFEKIPDDARIGIRGAGVHTNELLDVLNLSDKKIVGIFDREKVDDEFCGYPLLLASELRDKSLDYVIISNYFHRDEIKNELAGTTISVIDLYNELEKNGIQLRGPFYMYTSDSPLVLGYYYWNYKNSPSERTLMKFLRAALEQKNFVMISQAYEENGADSGKYPVLIETWRQSKELLKLIRDKLQQRRQNDIILLWTDAVSYSDLDSMPETKRRAETESCFFKRTYTHTPYTYATLQAMFCGALPIDNYPSIDYIINDENSSVLQYLKDNGYEFHCFANPEMKFDPCYFTVEQRYASNTVVWWHGLQSLLCQTKPCFYILQFLQECHPPVLYPMKEHVSKDEVYYRKTGKTIEHKKIGLAYLDRCLSLYNWLLGDKTQIQLSDHGFYWSSEAFWYESQLHAYCFVKGKNIPVVTVSELFPYKNFAHLLRWIIDPQHNRLEAATDSVVSFQDTDHYNPQGVATYISQGIPRQGLSYRGILSDQYKYVINSLGEESFYVFQNGQYVQESLKDEKLRQKLQAECGTHFLDIRKIERFKYSMELYKVIQEAEPDSGQPLWLTE